MKNTFLLCIEGFLIGFPLPIIVALTLNTLKGKRTAKVLQTIFTAPHFISLVVMVGMLQLFFGRYGLVNNIAENLGFERYSYFLESAAFRPMYILSSNWQDFGWSAIIYIAALANVDIQQHEAAILDGEVKLRLILDKYSVEVFVNDGEQVMTATFMTTPEATGISFCADGQVEMDITKYDLFAEE